MIIINSYISHCQPLPLAGNGNGEEVIKSWSMDNSYDGTDPVACGGSDNCVNGVFSSTWTIENSPSNGNIYCVNKSIELSPTANNTLSGIQIGMTFASTTTYDYVIGIYQESGDNARLAWGFGISGGTDIAHGDADEGVWDYFTGSFTTSSTNCQFNIYSGSAASGSTSDVVLFHFQIKEQ